MIDELLIVAAIGGLAYMAYRSTNKQSDESEQPLLCSGNNDDIDWLDEVAYEVLARKLKVEKSNFLASISKNGTDTLRRCKEVLDGAQWAFIREEQKNEIRARLEMTFTDGTSSKTEILKHWDDIPSSVRAEFLKSGSTSLSKEWVLPNNNNGR